MSARRIAAGLEGGPYDLALFRVAVCAVVLVYTGADRAAALAALPAELEVQRVSATFPLAWLPVDPTLARVAAAVLQGGAALGLVGFHGRVALAVATVAALYVLGVGQAVGAVEHHHHLVWFLAILAASPCADALSLDAARAAAAGRRPAPRALVYGVPIWTARVLIAAIFFFPGLWKLLESGWAWIASDNLRNQMYWKWLEHGGFEPPFRVDRHPLALRAAAFAAVAFELSFGPALLCRRLRAYAAGAAFAFHMATALFMNIHFTSLWPCYVVLFDARAALRGLGAEAFPSKAVVAGPAPVLAAIRSADLLGRIVYRRAPELRARWLAVTLRHPLAPVAAWLARAPKQRRARRSLAPSLAVASLLVPGVLVTGALGVTQGWPFACYPTFQWLAGEEIPYLAVDAVRADGSVVAISDMPRSQKEWGVHWSLVGATHGPPSAERIEAYWRLDARAQARARQAPATRVRFYRAVRSVVPERWGDPPTRRDLLHTMPP